MKLKSKEICPVSVRDRLVANLASQDNTICDLRLALDWAEEKCFELNEELKFARRIILSISEINKEAAEYVDMLRREKLI